MTRFGKRIALVGCLFGMCLPHKAPSHDAGNFFFDENYETDDKGNKVIGVFPGPTTFTTDLCTALKDGLDVFVQAGAMNCNDLPENFPENIRNYCMFSGSQVFQKCKVGEGVDNAVHCIKDFVEGLSASPPLEACTCHALRDSLLSIFSLSYLHCTATLQEATKALTRGRGGRDIGDYILSVSVTNERLLHSIGVDFNKTGGFEKSNITGFVQQLINWEMIKQGQSTPTPFVVKGNPVN